MDLEIIKKLVKIVDSSSVTDLEIEESGLKIKIAKKIRTSQVVTQAQIPVASVQPVIQPRDRDGAVRDHYERPARKHFRWWHGWAVRSRLKPMIEVARMLKRHFENIITYLRQRITNSASESINAKFQWVKYTARGLRNKKNFQTAIYFALRRSGYGSVMPLKSRKSQKRRLPIKPRMVFRCTVSRP